MKVPQCTAAFWKCEQLTCFVAVNVLVLHFDINSWDQIKIGVKFYFTYSFKEVTHKATETYIPKETFTR